MPVEPSEGLTRALFELGWTGVDLFFVLSGFLISSLLFKELDRTGTLELKRFWLRRGLKIWPSYFACFGVTVLIACTVELASGQTVEAGKQLAASLPNILFVQNYTGYQWPHTWSLAIEEHFYLGLPLLLLLLGTYRMRSLPAMMLFACTAVLALRVTMYLSGMNKWQSFYYPTHARIDALAFGVLLGYLHRYKRQALWSTAQAWPSLLILSLPLVAVAIRFPLTSSAFAVTLGFTLIYLGYGVWVVVAATHPVAGRDFLPARALAWLGTYSYTIYLAHGALSFVPAFGPESKLVNVWGARLLFWTLSIGGGVLLSHAVERPFLRYRREVLPSAAEALKSPVRAGVQDTNPRTPVRLVPSSVGSPAERGE
jgi:peptidoglycan/LPS O-acetylase OafA/YrhL